MKRKWGRRQPLMLRLRAIAAAALSCVLLSPSRSYSERTPDPVDGVLLELSAMGKHGEQIARARGRVLDILQHDNACSSWFQEVDPDTAGVFRSLHFELDREGPSLTYSKPDITRGQLIKQPWGAKSTELGGQNSIIQLNANGAFFKRISVLKELDPWEVIARPKGNFRLMISSYQGDTPEAQITILLHELGHIIGRLPEDTDSWDGRSSRNTSELLRHCKVEMNAAVRNSKGGS